MVTLSLDQQNLYGNIVSNHTVQLFNAPNLVATFNQSPPEQIASGVLIATGRNYYLVTCKHVFNDFQSQNIVVFTKDGRYINLPEEVKLLSGDADSIDLAIAEIEASKALELMTRYIFLPHHNLEFRQFEVDDQTCFIFGFINKQTKRKGKYISTNAFGFWTGFKKINDVVKMGFNYNNNILITYSRRHQGFIDSKSVNMGPSDLRGLSGGGIWYFRYLDGKYFFTLVGIMIEHRRTNSLIIGSQIRLLSDWIK